MPRKKTSSKSVARKARTKKPARKAAMRKREEEETLDELNEEENNPSTESEEFLEEVQGEEETQQDTSLPSGSDTLSFYLREIGKHPILSREEEHELAVKARNGNTEAFNKLVRSNLRYVVSVANRYKGFGLSLEDLINEGNIGLIHAIQRFDPDRGVKLITYAVWWIRQAIMHAIADHTGTVRLPIKQAGSIYKISGAFHELRQDLGREPSTAELAEHMEMKVDDLENILRVHRSYLSLDAPLTADDDTSYLDMLEAKDDVSVEENLLQHSLEEEIDDLLGGLDPREREIIRMRFGFDGEPMTLEEIGQRIGLSRERIRQIEKKVIRRFRARAKNKTLMDYLR